MSDDLKRSVDRMRRSLGDTVEGLKRVEASHLHLAAAQDVLADGFENLADQQKVLADQQKVLADEVKEMRADYTGIAGDLTEVRRHFETFVVRFDEVLPMLIEHDTNQLQRVAAVERSQDALRQEHEEFRHRLSELERRQAG